MQGLFTKVLGVLMMPLGFHRRMGARFAKSITRDFFHSPASLRLKLWSYRRGFYSINSINYGLNDKNYRWFLSDRDFLRMFPLNSQFRLWLDDKLTLRYVLQPFCQYLPKYYCLLDKGRLTPLMDAGGLAAVQDIIDLLNTEGQLALKQLTGSHGVGFCKLASAEGQLYLNHQVISEAGLLQFLGGLSGYLVSEYITQHPAMAAIYSGSVNTVRLMVINDGGQNPQVVNGYVRFGNSNTGAVDNIVAGGLFAILDLETGFFSNSKTIVDGTITNHTVHPDTGVPVEGVLPEWPAMTAKVLEIARYLGPLEYLGFDVAITADGIKVLEINSFQQVRDFQFYYPLLKDNGAADYFKSRIRKPSWF